MTSTDYSNGGDAKTLHRIAKLKWGGLEGMFIYFNWPERGEKMMVAAPKHIVHTFGSIRAFEAVWGGA